MYLIPEEDFQAKLRVAEAEDPLAMKHEILNVKVERDGTQQSIIHFQPVQYSSKPYGTHLKPEPHPTVCHEKSATTSVPPTMILLYGQDSKIEGIMDRIDVLRSSFSPFATSSIYVFPARKVSPEPAGAKTANDIYASDVLERIVYLLRHKIPLESELIVHSLSYGAANLAAVLRRFSEVADGQGHHVFSAVIEEAGPADGAVYLHVATKAGTHAYNKLVCNLDGTYTPVNVAALLGVSVEILPDFPSWWTSMTPWLDWLKEVVESKTLREAEGELRGFFRNTVADANPLIMLHVSNEHVSPPLFFPLH